MTKRLNPLAPLTDVELAAVEAVADGGKYKDIAPRLGWKYDTLIGRIRSASKKIPGTVPMRQKVVAWWRGGNRRALG